MKTKQEHGFSAQTREREGGGDGLLHVVGTVLALEVNAVIASAAHEDALAADLLDDPEGRLAQIIVDKGADKIGALWREWVGQGRSGGRIGCLVGKEFFSRRTSRVWRR